MAHIIKNIHWIARDGWSAELHCELDGVPAYLSILQKKSILKAGVVIISPNDVWGESLGTVHVPANAAAELEVDVDIECGLESNRLALALMQLQDAVDAGTWQDDARFKGAMPSPSPVFWPPAPTAP